MSATTKERVLTTDIIAHTVHPVLGEIKPDPAAGLLGTGFCRFEGPLFHGLARRCGPSLDLLSVVSMNPGKGKFPKWLKALKDIHSTIRAYEVMNPALLEHLRVKHGFVPFDEFGTTGPNLIWEKPQ